jgi:hypothetical protein
LSFLGIFGLLFLHLGDAFFFGSRTNVFHPVKAETAL